MDVLTYLKQNTFAEHTRSERRAFGNTRDRVGELDCALRQTARSPRASSAPRPAPRRRPAPGACRGRPPGPAAPSRSWCTGRAARPGRSAAPRGCVAATSSGVSIRSVATSIAPTSTSLPSSSADQLDRHVRVRAFERHLVDRRAREQRKRLLVLPPLAAERLLPVDVGLDAVAVADVDGGRAARGPARRARASRTPQSRTSSK